MLMCSVGVVSAGSTFFLVRSDIFGMLNHAPEQTKIPNCTKGNKLQYCS